MSRVVVDQLLLMLDMSFTRPRHHGRTDGWHALVANIESVREQDWDWRPAEGSRTICQLALHCGFATRMYTNYGFGDGTLQEREAAFLQGKKTPLMTQVMPWLIKSAQELRDALNACDDESLAEIRETHWGEKKTRRWFVTTMIEHNIYHAGEINHIRALAQGNDRW